MDAATAEISHLSVARLCVEIDLLKRLPPRIWLDYESLEGIWQDIIYEKFPLYCKHCKRLGHDMSYRKIAHPDLAKKPTLNEKNGPKPPQYVKKNEFPTPKL